MELLFNQTSRYATTLLVSVILSLVLTACNSPLSDIEVTDPGVLRPQFRVTYHHGEWGAEVTAVIRDKNKDGVALKNGYVSFNGTKMEQGVDAVGSPEYTLSHKIELDTDYIFEVVLADGKRYASNIRTPSASFGSITAPEKSDIRNDITVSWDELTDYGEITMKVVTHFEQENNVKVFKLTGEQIQSGSFKIPKSAFAKPVGAKSTSIEITSEKTGTIDPGFMGGSIFATSVWRKEVEFE